MTGSTLGAVAGSGGLTGAGMGAIVGDAAGNAGAGAAIGTAVGALTGAAIGDNIDADLARSKAEIEARMGRQMQGAVTPQDVVAMTQAGLSDDVIATHIRANGMAQPLAVNEHHRACLRGRSPRFESIALPTPRKQMPALYSDRSARRRALKQRASVLLLSDVVLPCDSHDRSLQDSPSIRLWSGQFLTHLNSVRNPWRYADCRWL